MRILLILILGALSGWSLYDRNDLKQQLTQSLDKLKQAQCDLEASNKKTESATVELNKISAQHQALVARLQADQTQHEAVLADSLRHEAELKAAAAAAKAEADRLAQKNWLQQQIEKRGDPLARPANPPAPAATVRRTYPYYYGYPY